MGDNRTPNEVQLSIEAKLARLLEIAEAWYEVASKPTIVLHGPLSDKEAAELKDSFKTKYDGSRRDH